MLRMLQTVIDVSQIVSLCDSLPRRPVVGLSSTPQSNPPPIGLYGITAKPSSRQHGKDFKFDFPAAEIIHTLFLRRVREKLRCFAMPWACAMCHAAKLLLPTYEILPSRTNCSIPCQISSHGVRRSIWCI